MIVKKYDQVKREDVKTDGAKQAYIRWLIGQDSGAPNFYLRHFEIEPGGHSPYHSHDMEHEVYVLAGKGQINTEDQPIPLETGSFALIMPGEMHQFQNTGNTTFKFLCVIPK
jgi:quercetin dioxygenase-like cupin family protein